MIGRWKSDGTSGTPHSELGDFSDVGVVGHEAFLAAFPLENKVFLSWAMSSADFQRAGPRKACPVMLRKGLAKAAMALKKVLGNLMHPTNHQRRDYNGVLGLPARNAQQARRMKKKTAILR